MRDGRIAVYDGAISPPTVESLFPPLSALGDVGHRSRYSGSGHFLKCSGVAVGGVEFAARFPGFCISVGQIIPGAVLRFTHINLTQYGDYQHVHTDQDGAREDPAYGSLLTVLYFANPSWEPDWLGEVMFYADDRREVVAAVTPVPGRIVVFDSGIPHRGGAPSRLCWERRVVVGMKWAVPKSPTS